MYKNNKRNSSNFKGCSPLQLLCNLTGTQPAIGYYFYTNRYQTNEQNHGSQAGIRQEPDVHVQSGQCHFQ